MWRYQKVVVIRRRSDGLYYTAPPRSAAPSWTADLRQANFVAPSKVRGLIRAEWGRDEAEFEAVPVVPALAPEEG